MRIRRATPDDAAEIRGVADAAWHEAYAELLHEETIETAIEEWYDLNRLSDGLADGAGDTFVAERDGEIVGFATGAPGGDDKSEAVLPTIYVYPDHWRDGIGSMLLERVTDVLVTEGFDRLSLSVLAENDVGCSFYERHGFEPRDEYETKLFGQHVTEVELVAEL